VKIDWKEEISELKSVKLFHALKFCLRAIRSGKFDFQPIEEILIPLVGSVPSGFSPNEMGFVIKECIVHGGQGHRELIDSLKKKMASLEISSQEWRLIYGKLLRKQFVHRSVVFDEFEMVLPIENIRNNCNALLSNFFEVFSNIIPIWIEFLGIFLPGKYFCVFDTIHAIVCYAEILKMRELGEEFDPGIGRTIFANPCPIQEFEGQMSANIDLVLLQFARALKRMGLEHFSSSASDIIGGFDDDFIFEINTTKSVLKVNWIVNPMAYEEVTPVVVTPRSKQRGK
jgi:hypothetical protein